MRNLRISIGYETKGDLSRIGASLKADPSDDQPGWFARVYGDDGYKDVMKYTRLPYSRIQQLASRLDAGNCNGPVSTAVAAQQAMHTRERAARRAVAESKLADAQRTLAQLDREESGNA